MNQLAQNDMRTSLDELQFCPTLHNMIQTGHVQLPNGEEVSIRGTSTLNNIRTIRQLITKERPGSTLEIGLAFGASALTFLATLNEIHGPSYHHTAIDPFQSEVWKSAAVHSIESAGLSQNFTHLEQDSALALPNLCSAGKTYDLIYVDGSHLFEDVFIDFFYCVRMLSRDGLILFDDCTDKHVQKVIRYIDKNYSAILQRENVGDAVEHSLKRRLAHAIGIQQLVVYRKIEDPPRKWNAPFRNF